MKTYAILDGTTKVLRYEHFDEEQSDLFLVGEGKLLWPAGPTPAHELHVINDELVFVDPRTLEQAKFDKWEQIKLWRTAAIDSNMTTPYGVFQCRAEDRQNITDAIMLGQTLASLEQPVAIPWTLADNSVVTLDLTQIVTVGLLLGQKVQAAHATARTLRSLIEAAETVEAVTAIDWPQ